MTVVVIGGGVMGCAVAWRLAAAGASVRVLERAVPGAEASSAAAGILAAQEEAEGPGPLFELCLASRARFPAVVAELQSEVGMDVGYRPTGLLSVAATDAEADALETRYGWQRERGLRVEWLRGTNVQAAEPALDPRFQAALSFPDDHQLEPRAYLKALSLAAMRAGATFTTGAQVRRIVTEGDRAIGVELDGETVAAETIVVAAGSWSSLVPGAGLPARAVRPMRGQIVQLETRPPAVRGTIVAPGGYLVGRADGRLLVGSTMEHAGYDRRVTAGGIHHVLDLALTLAPSLRDAPVTETWANFRPTTPDRLPALGLAPVRGVVVATGHFRNGILLSPITALVVRSLVLEGKAPDGMDLAAFRPDRAGLDQDSA
jgi:glycine oxidase